MNNVLSSRTQNNFNQHNMLSGSAITDQFSHPIAVEEMTRLPVHSGYDDSQLSFKNSLK